MSEQYLLNDAEVARFLVTGYHLVEPELPVGLNENIADQLDALFARCDAEACDRSSSAVPYIYAGEAAVDDKNVTQAELCQGSFDKGAAALDAHDAAAHHLSHCAAAKFDA